MIDSSAPWTRTALTGGRKHQETRWWRESGVRKHNAQSSVVIASDDDGAQQVAPPASSHSRSVAPTTGGGGVLASGTMYQNRQWTNLARQCVVRLKT